MNSEKKLPNEILKEKTIWFLMGMLQEKIKGLDKPPKDYEEGAKFYSDKNAKNKRVLIIEEKSFTPKQILNEIQKNGDLSDVLVQMINDHRIKMSKMEK